MKELTTTASTETDLSSTILAASFREEMMVLSLEHETAHLSPSDFDAMMALGDKLDEAQARAAQYEACSVASTLAWQDVSILSERLATFFPSRTYAGAGPRIGAVIAAIASADALRAWALLARYEEEGVDPETSESLRLLDEEATVLYLGIRQGGAVSFVTVPETL